ncbi:hypothetical protein [Helicobacter sp. 23-1045]
MLNALNATFSQNLNAVELSTLCKDSSAPCVISTPYQNIANHAKVTTKYINIKSATIGDFINYGEIVSTSTYGISIFPPFFLNFFGVSPPPTRNQSCLVTTAKVPK